MSNIPESTHPVGEANTLTKEALLAPIKVDTYAGTIHMEWDPDARVTPIGQLPFFIQFLKLGQRFDPWVEECPLVYHSNNAPKIRDLLGSLFLSILSGHTRYAHIATLRNDNVNRQLLGMSKIISDDSARRALKKIDEQQGVDWLTQHIMASYLPLLTIEWIMDVDVTVKPVYGHQEGAVIAYNPKKPGRPCQTYHTYIIANLRLILDVEVQAGNKGASCHSLPGLIKLIDSLDESNRPRFVRGDCDWGSDGVMSQLEDKGVDYLFKMRKSPKVNALINKEHGLGKWTRFKTGWEAKEASLRLSSWPISRRVVLVRRRAEGKDTLAIEHNPQGKQLSLSFIDGPEDMKAYEYSVLVTSLADDVISIVQHYRDRADCENNFDELKNQWGWGGFTTQKLVPCKLMAQMIALVYNWWTLFVRLIEPKMHKEAITSRPTLLSSVGRLTESGRKKTMTLTPGHKLTTHLIESYQRVGQFFTEFKEIAPQLTSRECWQVIVSKIMAGFLPIEPLEKVEVCRDP